MRLRRGCGQHPVPSPPSPASVCGAREAGRRRARAWLPEEGRKERDREGSGGDRKERDGWTKYRKEGEGEEGGREQKAEGARGRGREEERRGPRGMETVTPSLASTEEPDNRLSVKS